MDDQLVEVTPEACTSKPTETQIALIYTYVFLRRIGIFTACMYAGYLFGGRHGEAWGIVWGIICGLLN